MKYSLLALAFFATFVNAVDIKNKPLTGCESVTCPKINGLIAIHKEHPFRCDSFCKCDWGNAVYFKCPDGLHFNKDLEVCDWPEVVGCDNSGIGGQTTKEPGVGNPTPSPPEGDDQPEVCSNVVCPAENGEFALHLPNPEDCASFCKCDWGTPYLFDCPAGLHFNPELQVCDWPQSAGCEDGGDTEVTTPPPTGPIRGCENVRCPTTNTNPLTNKPNPDDCGSYCICKDGMPNWVACGSELHFNEATQLCEHPLNAGCDPNWTESTTTTTKKPSSTTNKPSSTTTTTKKPSSTTNKPSSTTVDTKPTSAATSAKPSSTSATSKPTTSPSGPTSAPNGCNNVVCPPTNDGNIPLYPNPENCGSFCMCNWGKPVFMACPPGLHFNPVLQICDWPENVDCQAEGDQEETTVNPPGPTTKPTSVATSPRPSSSTNVPIQPTIPTKPTVLPTGPTSAPNGCENVACPPTNEGNATHYPNPEDCGSFCKCDWGKPVWFACPDGLHFNSILEVCDWPENVDCAGEGDPGQTTVNPPGPTTKPTSAATSPKPSSSTNVPIQPTIPTRSTSSSPQPTVPPTGPTSAPNGCENVICPPTNDGNATHYPNPEDCGSFCKCDWGKPVWFTCPPGLHFNPDLQVCDWPENVNCGEGDPGQTTVSPGETTKPPGGGTTKPPGGGTTQSPGGGTTKPPGSDGCANANCPPAGECGATNVPNPDSCNSFCRCENGNGIWKPCPPGLSFNPDTEICDWPQNVNCNDDEEITTPATNSSTPIILPTISIKTTPNPSPTTPAGSGTTPGGNTAPPNACKNVICPPTNEGNATHLPNPGDCTSFCKCDWGNPIWFACPPGLHFNPALQICDWSDQAGCTEEGGDPEETTLNPSGSTTTENPGAVTTRPPNPTLGPNGCPKVNCPAENGEFALHLPNPDDCASFCKCDWGAGYYFDCPAGLHFNPILQVCDWPQDAGCVDGPAADPVPRRHSKLI